MKRAGFLPGVGAAGLALAEFEAEQGRPEQARELLDRAREVFERIGMERFLGFVDEVERGLPARASERDFRAALRSAPPRAAPSVSTGR